MQAAERPDQNKNRKWDAEQPQQQVPSHYALLFVLSFLVQDKHENPGRGSKPRGFPSVCLSFDRHRPMEPLGNMPTLGFAAMQNVASRVRP